MEYQPVNPVRPVAPYLGGKRQLSAHLAQMIDGIDHACYVEVFMGMGGVFFKRQRRPKAEVINDASRDVANLFRVLNRHYAAFIDMLRFQLTSRADFQRLKDTPAEVLTDLERAARFLYLQRVSFGGKVRARSFGYSTTEGGRFNLTTLEPMLQEVHERLAGVVIECLDWREVMERYDRPVTLFYLDPPYFGHEKDYGEGLFSRTDFEDMAARLARLKGRFILSLNDRKEVRQVFRDFKIQGVAVSYTAGGAAKTKPAREVIITGP